MDNFRDLFLNCYLCERYITANKDNLDAAIKMAHDNFLLQIHPLFDPEFYLEKYPDVKAANINPLLHYLKNGWQERRWPNPYFDPSYYLQYAPKKYQNEDALKIFITQNYKIRGNPHPFLDLKTYLELNPDITEAGVEPFEHFITLGVKENRNHCTLFDGVQKEIFDYSQIDKINALFKPGLAHPMYSDQGFPNLRNEDNLAKRVLYHLQPFDPLYKELTNRRLSEKIFFSIIIPVYNIESHFLKDTVNSALKQNYDDYEIIIVNDSSDSEDTLNFLVWLNQTSDKVKVINSEKNLHISAATNLGVENARGDYIVLLDHDDLLVPNSLLSLAYNINKYDNPDFLYSDEARLNASLDYVRSSLSYHTGWSPELLLSYCYFSHLSCVKTTIYKQLGGMQVGIEGSQDHDFFLRLSEVTEKVVHIEEILYIRRAVPTSISSGSNPKPYAVEAGARAVKEAWKRRGFDLEVFQPEWAKASNLGIYTVDPPSAGPEVTIIIPTISPINLRNLLISLRKTSYQNYSIKVISNDPSFEFDDIKFVDRVVQIIRLPQQNFNFSEICNFAATQVTTPYILFLNDDTEVIDPNWLSHMMLAVQLKGVGAVGIRLLYPSKQVQHGGISMGRKAYGYTMFRGLSYGDGGKHFYARVMRNCQAVTGACLLMPKNLFVELGGFNEKEFAVAYNDVDLCLRVWESGRRIVYCGNTEMVHAETATRSKIDNPKEILQMRIKYPNIWDPFYNHHWNPYALTMHDWFQADERLDESRRLKILFVSHNLNREGAPLSLFQLATGLKNRYPSFVCEILSPIDGNLKTLYEKAGIKVRICPLIESVYHNSDNYKYLRRILARKYFQGYDVVLANTCLSFWAIDVASSQGIPALWIIREASPAFLYMFRLWHNYSNLIISCFKRATWIIFVSYATSHKWHKLECRYNFTVIPNCLNESYKHHQYDNIEKYHKQRDVDNESISVLCVGTVETRKGQLDLILAAIYVNLFYRKKLDVHIIGNHNSDYARVIKQFVKTLPYPLQSMFKIIDEVENISYFYNRADLYFCGSREESAPKTILEAMSAGLPILTTPVDGIPEQVINGANAYFYKPGNITELSRRLMEMRNEEILRKMSEASMAIHSATCDFNEIVEKYGRLILHAASVANIRAFESCEKYHV